MGEKKRKQSCSSSESRWSDLPADILSAILLSIPCLEDRIHAGAVCKHWSTQSTPSFSLPSPMLRLCSSAHEANKPNSFSLSDGYFYHFPPIPDIPFGSFEKWLLIAQLNGDSFLLDPFSGTKISLPAIPTGAHGIKKMILSSSPSKASDDNPVVVAIQDTSGEVMVCSLKGKIWSTPWMQPDSMSIDSDIAFYKGLLHGVTNDGYLYIYNCKIDEDGTVRVNIMMHPTVMPVEVQDRNVGRTYLLQTRGVLMMVKRFTSRVSKESKHDITSRFKVFELRCNRHWYSVESLEGHAMFLGATCAKSVPASMYKGVEKEGIYFTDHHHDNLLYHWMPLRVELPPGCLDSGVFSMKNGSIKSFKTASRKLLPEFIRTQLTPLWFNF